MKNWFTPRRVLKRWDFYARALPNFPEMIWKRVLYQRVQFDAASYLRDEAGILNDRQAGAEATRASA